MHSLLVLKVNAIHAFPLRFNLEGSEPKKKTIQKLCLEACAVTSVEFIAILIVECSRRNIAQMRSLTQHQK